jgi:hypothetical protein
MELRSVRLLVERNFPGRRRGRRVGEGDLVDVDVAPAAGLLVDDSEARLFALQFSHVPREPREVFGVFASDGADHSVFDQELDAGATGVRAAADEEGEVVAADGERRRRERAGRLVAVEVRVDQAAAEVAVDGHLAGQGASGRAGAEGVAGGDPAAVVARLEVRNDDVVRRASGGGEGNDEHDE